LDCVRLVVLMNGTFWIVMSTQNGEQIFTEASTQNE